VVAENDRARTWSENVRRWLGRQSVCIRLLLLGIDRKYSNEPSIVNLQYLTTKPESWNNLVVSE
jgi:hypothetical protein